MSSSTLILKKRMKHVLIPGGGLIGLYALHKLTVAGVKHITVVEPRLDEFDREGDLAPVVVSDMEKSVGFELKHSGAFRICDIQHSLYAKADKDVFKKASFKSFHNGKAVIEDAKHKITELDCDLLLDCSGTNQVGVNAVNAIQPNFFTTKQAVAYSPFHLMFVQFTMNSHEVTLWENFYDSAEYKKPNFSNQFRQDKILKLRKLGWKHFSVPFHYVNDFKNPSYDRVHFFTEAPDELKDPVKQTEWVMTMAQIAIGHDQISLKICNKKDSKELAISHYQVNPKQTTPAYFPGNQDAPAMFPHCDATFNMPSITGASVLRGMFRVDHFIKSMTIEKKSGEITEINITNYLKMFDDSMKMCAQETEDAYKIVVRRYHPGRKEYKNFILLTFFDAQMHADRKGNSKSFNDYCETLVKALDTDAPLSQEIKQDIKSFLQEYGFFKTVTFHKASGEKEVVQGTAPTPGNLMANGKT
jgi:hypothetical protein